MPLPLWIIAAIGVYYVGCIVVGVAQGTLRAIKIIRRERRTSR